MLNNPVQDEKVIAFAVDNGLSIGSDISFNLPIPFGFKLKKCKASVVTAPVGADIIVDININGVSIWSVTQANRLTISDGDDVGAQTVFDNDTFTEDQIATLDIDQVGSGTAGSSLVVEMIGEQRN